MSHWASNPGTKGEIFVPVHNVEVLFAAVMSVVGPSQISQKVIHLMFV
jgi:hypothetical protein